MASRALKSIPLADLLTQGKKAAPKPSARPLTRDYAEIKRLAWKR